ncbi:MAG TPA: metal ABC transporter ATP-binding protein [Pirellulales bacterium]
MPPLVDVHDVTVAFDRRPVLWDVDLVIEQPHLVGIVGPHGSGRSTLINAILGLVPLASGSIEVFGEPVSAVRKRIGFVPERDTVDWDFPISVLDIVMMGTYGRLGWFHRPGSSERRLAQECLEKVGLAEFAQWQIGRLSSSQQQRALLARALAQRADIYFMDEPMAGVDAATEQAVFNLFEELQRDGKTAVVVHHDLRTVPKYFDYVVLLNMRLVASGPTETTFTRENLQQTYGGRLEVLETAGRAFQAGQRTP